MSERCECWWHGGWWMVDRWRHPFLAWRLGGWTMAAPAKPPMGLTDEETDFILNDSVGASVLARLRYSVRAAYARGRADQRKLDAEIAQHPYGDAVRALGSDEPLEVGHKIAAAIEKESADAAVERADGE